VRETAAEAVGMWESRPLLGEASKGLVERVGSLLLAFHAFHSPDISTALCRSSPSWLG
jgi:hypothetical protein